MGHGIERLRHGIYHATEGLLLKSADEDEARAILAGLVALGEDAAALSVAPVAPDAPFPPRTPGNAHLSRQIDRALGFDPDRD